MYNIKMTKLDESYFSLLKSSMESFAELDDKEWQHLKSLFRLVQYKKGDLLISPGQRADVIFFIGKGLVKRYFNCHDGRQFITSLDSEARIVSDFVSLIEESPSKIFIEAIEDTDVLVSDYAVSKNLFDQSDVWQKIGRKITELRYLEKSRREYELLHYDTKDRLINFKENNPDLYKRLTQKDLARYLGIAPESLSRLIRSMNS